jgi:hypothetical protein
MNNPLEKQYFLGSSGDSLPVSGHFQPFIQSLSQKQNRSDHLQVLGQGEMSFEEVPKLQCMEETFLQPENPSTSLPNSPLLLPISQSSVPSVLSQSQTILQPNSSHNISFCLKESPWPPTAPQSNFTSSTTLQFAYTPPQTNETINPNILQPSAVVVPRDWDPLSTGSRQNTEESSCDTATNDFLQLPQIPQLNIHSPPTPPNERLQRPDLSSVFYFSTLEPALLSNNASRTSTPPPSLAPPSGILSAFPQVSETSSKTSSSNSVSNHVSTSTTQLSKENSLPKFPLQIAPLVNNSPSVGLSLSAEDESSQTHDATNNNTHHANSPTENKKRKATDPLFFFENPLHMVNPQTKYRRLQLHLGLANSCVYESDFSENEGVITIWRLKEYNPVDGNYVHSLFTMEPAAILYANYVSRVVADKSHFYCVYGGDGLWLSWWDITTLKEEKCNFTPRLKPLGIELPICVTGFYFDDEFLYIACLKGHILIAEKKTRKINKVLKLKSSFFAHVLKSDSHFLYAGFSDGSVRLWYKHKNWKKKKQVCMDKNEKNQVRNIEVDYDNIYIGFSKALQVLKKDAKNIVDVQTLKFESELFALCSDNEYLYLGFRGNLSTNISWSRSLRLEGVRQTRPQQSKAINFNSFLWAGGLGKVEIRTKATLQLCNVTNLKTLSPVRSLLIDNQYLYVDCYPLRVFEKHTMKEVATLGDETPVMGRISRPMSGVRITWSDNELIVGGCRDGHVYIWRRKTNSLVAEIPPPTEESLSFTNNAIDQMVTAATGNRHYIFVGYHSGCLRVIERATFNYDSLSLLPTARDQSKPRLTKLICLCYTPLNTFGLFS